MVKVLILDVETTGLPVKVRGNLPPYTQSEYYDKARIFQLSCLMVNTDTLKAYDYNVYIRDHFDFPADYPFDIDDLLLLEDLADEKMTSVIAKFYHLVSECDVILGHNVSFDITMLMAEAYRYFGPEALEFIYKLDSTPKLCTMALTTNLLKLPGKYGYKYPKLIELYEYCFDAEFKAHDAKNDVLATWQCFVYLYLNKSIILPPGWYDKFLGINQILDSIVWYQ